MSSTEHAKTRRKMSQTSTCERFPFQIRGIGAAFGLQRWKQIIQVCFKQPGKFDGIICLTDERNLPFHIPSPV